MYESERAAAIDAVIKACRLTTAVQERLVAGSSLQKGDRSPVTVADYGAQAIVGRLLALEFPHLPMVGEEDAALLRDPQHSELKAKVVEAARTVLPDLHEDEVLSAIDAGTFGGGASGQHWTLDPIDGTKGFLRLEQYAVALALIDRGEVVLGVLGCPNLPLDPSRPDGDRGCLFVAVRGEGATVRPIVGGVSEPLRVSDLTDPARTRFVESVESGHTAQGDSARVAAILGIEAAPVRLDSQAKYGVVARGEASIYLRLPTRQDYVEKIWDHAAGAVIVEEAGGRVTDIHGRPLRFGLGRGLSENKGVVVTNGALHDGVIEAVERVVGAG
jgi:3'(2'), 5'-bisphosphate nucleotidase